MRRIHGGRMDFPHTGSTGNIDSVSMPRRRHISLQVSSTLLALCKRNPTVTGGFPSQRASNAEIVSMTWRLPVLFLPGVILNAQIFAHSSLILYPAWHARLRWVGGWISAREEQGSWIQVGLVIQEGEFRLSEPSRCYKMYLPLSLYFLKLI